MSAAAVRPAPLSGLLALAISLALHTSLVAVSMVPPRLHRSPPKPLENESVAMVGNSIEVDAPTPELASTPAAPEQEEPLVGTEGETEAANPRESQQPRPTAEADAENPKPKPKPEAETETPEPKPKPKTKPALDPATAHDGSSVAPIASAPSPGNFGAEGLKPGVRRLGYAFARAIPAYTPTAADWCRMPAGSVGRIRVELTVDGSNHVTGMQTWKARANEPEPPAALKAMAERTLSSLELGEFALSGSNDAGTERLTIDVTLRDEAPDETGQCLVVEKGFHGATPGAPGEAHFRFGTGRVFDAKVTIAPRD